MTRSAFTVGSALLLLAIVPSANSQAKYDPGVNLFNKLQMLTFDGKHLVPTEPPIATE
jgi:hypothetical protein